MAAPPSFKRKNDKRWNNAERNHGSGDMVTLGRSLHTCGNLLVVKLEHKDIPYPGSPVFFSGAKAAPGKVDEIFGRLDGAFAAIKPEAGTDFGAISKDTELKALKDKFIPRGRFMSREEVEKKKIGKPVAQKKGIKGGNRGAFGKARFNSKDRFSSKDNNKKRFRK